MTSLNLKVELLKKNAEITRNILNGTLRDGKRNAVCLNAGAAIYVAGKADSLAEGIKIAEETIDSGKAIERMNEIVAFSNQI